MRNDRWRGVRLRTVEAGADPDAPAHRVALPAGWPDEAARGLVSLCCEGGPRRWDPLRLPDAAGRWISRVAGSAGDDALADALHRLVLHRQACPDPSVWRGETTGAPWFVLNLASFAEPDAGLDETGLCEAVSACVLALSVLSPDGRPAIRLADIDGLLARLGLDYDGASGRETASRVVRTVRRAVGVARVRLETGPAGPAEALLGVETAGFAPAFSPVGAHGGLTEAARARLSSLGLSAERALALTLDGETPLRIADSAAHRAMHEAVSPLLDACPTLHASIAPRATAVAPSARRPMPARSKGFTQKVTIGGQRLFLRTGEYEDGALGEMSITLAGRDHASLRGLADALSTAMSVSLQHGVPLSSFVDAFAHGRFGASGAVEGDPSIAWASSPLDYVMRALSDAYLGRPIADPPAETGDDWPLLPLGLAAESGGEPRGAGHTGGRTRQRALRLVSLA